MPLTNNSANMPARWGVQWVGPTSGKLLFKEFDDDFQRAIEWYARLKEAKAKNVTLRSMNVGFPPPKRITQHEETKIIKKNGKKIRRTTTINLMQQFNQEGAWWCPYCIKMRRFKRKITHQAIVMVCPACGISSRDGHVKRHNPYAAVVEMRRHQIRTKTNGRQRTVRRRA